MRAVDRDGNPSAWGDACPHAGGQFGCRTLLICRTRHLARSAALPNHRALPESHDQPDFIARPAGSQRACLVMADLPPRARAEVQRVLDGAARRLLAEQVDLDALDAAAGRDRDAIDGRADQGAAFVQREQVPILERRHGHGGARAA